MSAGGAAVDSLQLAGWISGAIFSLGLLGVIVRRNVLVMLMCMELMLNAVNLSLVVFAQRGDPAAASVLVFLVFVVAAAEIAIAIPIVLLLARNKRSLDLGSYTDLQG
jgi:NADH-quinone oxidoreductase subunit K